MLAWFAQTGKPVHILMTKVDKLTRTEQSQALAALREALRGFGDDDFAGRCSVQGFSSLKKIGVDAAEDVLGAWLGMEPPVRVLPPSVPRTEKIARPRKRSAQGWSARSAAKPVPPPRSAKSAGPLDPSGAADPLAPSEPGDDGA
jgi:GTP-binding protein